MADHHAAVMEGSPEKVIVILQFPSADVARQWYDSPEYREVKHLRTSTTEGWLLIADEFVEPGE